VESLDMTSKSKEMLRSNLYVLVGLLGGLAIGIGVSPQFRELVISNGWPKESISWITMFLIFVSVMLNAFLYLGWKKVDARESVLNPIRHSENT
jgi:hypothetical protein